jgi:short-subunit dehydrogenase
MYDYAGGVALVTGASSGIGQAMARALALRGVGALVLVARSKDRLEALARELRARHNNLRIEVVPADLSDPGAADRILAATERRGLAVDLLVNNAGFGSHGYFDERGIERETGMIAVNVRAVVTLTRAYLPGMVARRRGAIINVASTAAFQPVPGTRLRVMATYAATKAFVLSFSEALWAENRGRGVRVVCLCPGSTDTAFEFDSAGRGEFERWPRSSPEEVARAGLDALERDASTVVVGRGNYLQVLSVRLAPRSVIARITANIFRPGPASTRNRAVPALLGALAGAALLGYISTRGRD